MIKRIDNFKNKTRRIKVCIFVLFVALIFRLGYIQIISHSKIDRMVSRLIARVDVEEAKRGDILDANGRVFATSVRRYILFLDAKKISNFHAVKRLLKENKINLKQNSLQELDGKSYIPVADNLSEEIVERIRKASLSGIGFESKYTRQYPEGRMASPVLGIIGTNSKGLSGIEQEFEKYLAGTDVPVKQTRDGMGTILHEKIIDRSKINGLPVQLTIDMNIQFIAERELRKAFLASRAKNAVCIVQNPKTGEILAMVSLPDFSPYEKIKDTALLRNYAISDMFEPGSTFKIVAIAAALNENKITPNDYFFLENGVMKIGNHKINDDHLIEGSASVETIMAMSSNIGLVKIAQKLGRNLFYKYIRKFGFYSLSDIDLPGEARGSLSDIRQGDSFYLPAVSFGQGMSVTAIQITNAFSVIANGGVLMKPILIKSIGGNQYSQEYGQKEIRRVITPETAAQMREMLKAAVDKGTGKQAKVPGYSVGGKTGTAQKYDVSTKQYSKHFYISSFAGMIPAQNPEVVIFVLFDEPKENYYASSISAPVFRNIARQIAAYLNIPRDEK
ncbi:MAG: penicillin-binding protein 2 [Elusimicrobiota bacterium]|jgi:cell division protein FtsI (penicillin-binding protein 3)|nr:penicillin-binding protein 2 [Elusimicrobiota bacterium]